MPPKCSICTDKRVKQVNNAISGYRSMRYIALHILEDERRFMSVSRHANNCLKFDTQKALNDGLLDSRVQVYKEFQDQLRFAKKLREASQEYLSDPDTNAITLIPRSDEVDVVYYDTHDRTQSGDPKRKTAKLQTLLEKMDDAGYIQSAITIKHTDIRDFALKAISTIDSTLDKFAKIEGSYTKEKDNPQSIDITEQVVARLEALGYSREEVIERVNQRLPELESIAIQ